MIMWLWLAIASALFLGLYDVAKKQSLKKNSVMMVLLLTTALSTLFMSPYLSKGPLSDHLFLLLKAVLVSGSWISGLYGMKYLPITTASTIKASRPMFVVLFSILIFGERLNLYQWGGVILVLTALWMLSRSSKTEGIYFSKDKGVFCMVIAVFTGVCSALLDNYILDWMEPLFVQSWCNLYITVIMGLVTLFQWLSDKESFQGLKWDWLILVIAVFITISDYMYFKAVHDEKALLSVVSLLRRFNVIVTFVCGAILFKEKNLKAKSLDLFVLMLGMVLLLFGSK